MRDKLTFWEKFGLWFERGCFFDGSNWYDITIDEELSERFIEKYKHKIKWSALSKSQALSEEFIERYKDYVDWYWIARYQKLAEEFRIKYNIKVPKTCWLYKTKEEKLDYIKRHTDYEIIDDEYVVAYLRTNHDGSALYREGYYQPGKLYRCNYCDCNIDEEGFSFGIYAWTKGEALKQNYRSGKLFKVRIPVNDIGVVIQTKYMNMIRCYAVEVLDEPVN